MTRALLPVRPAPRPGEPLAAYAARLADANGVTRARILPAHRQDVAVPPSELATVAALAGLAHDQAGLLTLDRYPLAVRGRGATHRYGWRLHHSVRWTCPGCTATTGRTELLWQTALMPVCLNCGVYLTAATDTTKPSTALSEVLDLAARLADLAEDSVDTRSARRRLARLRRRCAAIAQTIDQTRPPRPDRFPPVDEQAARRWGAYPSPDPSTVATILSTATGLTRRSQGRRSLGGDAIATRPACGTPAFDDQQRLDWFLTRLRHHINRDGLRPGHVPSLLPASTDEDQQPGPGAWLARARAATALHLLISLAGGLDATTDAALAALGLAGIPTSRLIDDIATSQGLRGPDAAVLSDGLDLLLAAELLDYRRRRATLRSVTHLPSRTRRQLRLADGYDSTGEQLALGWIWTRFTGGPMRASHWPHLPDRDIRALDQQMDPETRLILHETGQQLLADADLTTIPQTRATWPAITRRYG